MLYKETSMTFLLHSGFLIILSVKKYTYNSLNKYWKIKMFTSWKLKRSMPPKELSRFYFRATASDENSYSMFSRCFQFLIKCIKNKKLPWPILVWGKYIYLPQKLHKIPWLKFRQNIWAELWILEVCPKILLLLIWGGTSLCSPGWP